MVNNEIQVIVNKIVKIENELKGFKDLEKQYKNFKEELFNKMLENDVKKITLVNGTMLTRVDKTEAIKKVLDKEALTELLQGMDLSISNFEKSEITYRNGYVKITQAKE